MNDHNFTVGSDVRLAGAAYSKYQLGDSTTDEEVSAAAKVAARLAVELAAFGPDFALARRALATFGSDMAVHELRRRTRQAAE